MTGTDSARNVCETDTTQKTPICSGRQPAGLQLIRESSCPTQTKHSPDKDNGETTKATRFEGESTDRKSANWLFKCCIGYPNMYVCIGATGEPPFGGEKAGRQLFVFLPFIIWPRSRETCCALSVLLQTPSAACGGLRGDVRCSRVVPEDVFMRRPR